MPGAIAGDVADEPVAAGEHLAQAAAVGEGSKSAGSSIEQQVGGLARAAENAATVPPISAPASTTTKALDEATSVTKGNLEQTTGAAVRTITGQVRGEGAVSQAAGEIATTITPTVAGDTSPAGALAGLAQEAARRTLGHAVIAADGVRRNGASPSGLADDSPVGPNGGAGSPAKLETALGAGTGAPKGPGSSGPQSGGVATGSQPSYGPEDGALAPAAGALSSLSGFAGGPTSCGRSALTRPGTVGASCGLPGGATLLLAGSLPTAGGLAEATSGARRRGGARVAAASPAAPAAPQPPVEGPNGLAAPAGAAPAGFSTSIFLSLAGLLLLGLPRAIRRLRLASESWQPVPFVLIPERPG